MKSGRQRRAEIMSRRNAKRAANLVKNKYLKGVSVANQYGRQHGSVPVNPANLSPNNSYGIPEFVKRGFYADLPFTCKQCGTPQIWTAQQQHWWYELAKGDVWTIAVLCRPCRIKESERKALARKIHLEGLLRKRQLSNNNLSQEIIANKQLMMQL
ncbi:putative zinc-binding protein [Methyloglobulus morosus KoM1]|uniref:Putative zinc-binding protein n=1 Tax=Methyloglobulus morosus KoM1 TaxID=1116472 RepID=V5BM79_9GAMM|nr:zinc-ribbon domain containing protein [Methyloglobulus morosus]ESS68914.1 putative zinc-binding protein [Methyloglobulus morosus KoM1]